ncbi:hypothetical protein B0H10DRAFT_1939883 [Mycena sp. CBHHK59/15]|nr:hypothetical protein B0H10DRAFT_1939883 [Mycena sp. CBHHK59/15]
MVLNHKMLRQVVPWAQVSWPYGTITGKFFLNSFRYEITDSGLGLGHVRGPSTIDAIWVQSCIHHMYDSVLQATKQVKLWIQQTLPRNANYPVMLLIPDPVVICVRILRHLKPFIQELGTITRDPYWHQLSEGFGSLFCIPFWQQELGVEQVFGQYQSFASTQLITIHDDMMGVRYSIQQEPSPLSFKIIIVWIAWIAPLHALGQAKLCTIGKQVSQLHARVRRHARASAFPNASTSMGKVGQIKADGSQ